MDNNGLRIIANPYLLKKKIAQTNNKDQLINDLLYEYLDAKYKKIFISPNLYYKVIDGIDELIIRYEIEQIISEIIDEAINKFDNG